MVLHEPTLHLNLRGACGAAWGETGGWGRGRGRWLGGLARDLNELTLTVTLTPYSCGNLDSRPVPAYPFLPPCPFSACATGSALEI